jgi:hypothetical protein
MKVLKDEPSIIITNKSFRRSLDKIIYEKVLDPTQTSKIFFIRAKYFRQDI